jgi:hypothetical protein
MSHAFPKDPQGQFIYLLKSDFHKMNSIARVKDKTFVIKCCSASFFFSKEQILLLSIKAFQNISQTHKPFHIIAPLHIKENVIISCFREIYSLFSKTDEIIISRESIIPFSYLSEVLENSFLISICENVLSCSKSRSFFLTSELFNQIPDRIFHRINNYRIIVQEGEIECNRIFSSLISTKIFNHLQNDSDNNFIDFRSFPSPHIIQLFCLILKGQKIPITDINQSDIIETINFLEFDSVSTQPFIHNSPFNFMSHDLTELGNLPLKSIQTIFSSSFFHLKNENQLFKILVDLFHDNSEYLNVLKYVYFGFLNHFDLKNFINSLHFHEIDSSLFDHLKYSLFSSYLLSLEINDNLENDQILLFYSDFFCIFFSIGA